MDIDLRVGSGFDLHRLKHGRPFQLCGVTLDSCKGPFGHSDGDPLAHAVSDALLGAAGLGDIGRHFPDSDSRWKDCPGSRILELTAGKALEAGFKVVNADATVFLEEVRLAPYKDRIVSRLEKILQVGPGRVNLKGKTWEGYGSVGLGESVGAQATVLLVRAENPAGGSPLV